MFAGAGGRKLQRRAKGERRQGMPADVRLRGKRCCRTGKRPFRERLRRKKLSKPQKGRKGQEKGALSEIR